MTLCAIVLSKIPTQAPNAAIFHTFATRRLAEIKIATPATSKGCINHPALWLISVDVASPIFSISSMTPIIAVPPPMYLVRVGRIRAGSIGALCARLRASGRG